MMKQIAGLIIACVLVVSVGILEATADPEENKGISRRAIEEVWNQKKLDVIDEIYAADFVFHDPSESGLSGPEGYRQFASMYQTAFPDVQFTIEDLIASGDKVALRWTATGTQKAELMGIPPTDLYGITTGIVIDRIVDGKIVEEWTHWDALGQMQNLGVIAPARPTEEHYKWGASSEVTGEPGDPEKNKAIVLDSIKELWNKQNLDVIGGETWSPDFVAHTPVELNNPLVGTEVNRQTVTAYLTAFPDMHVVNEDVFAAGDKVVVRWKTTATHKGDLMGLPPTGKKVEFTGITIYRIADGKMVETWWAWDALGLMQQLTATPETEKE